MADDLSTLGEDDLSRLLQVIESLEHSPFDFLQLEVGGMKVVLGKGDPSTYLDRLGAPAPAGAPAPVAMAPPTGPPAPAGPPAPPAAAPPAAAPSAAPSAAPVAAPAGTVEITAPMMGIFYAQPEPGAPPYVEVGTVVEADTTVALVEVMKMFNAIPAGVSGTVEAVLVEGNQLVEYGQALFRVRPS